MTALMTTKETIRFDAASGGTERSTATVEAYCEVEPEQVYHDEQVDALAKRFGVEIIQIDEPDDAGEVFDTPDRIELELMIKDDLLIFCEARMFTNKGTMYFFERQVRFYERRHQRKASRMIVISCVIEESARRLGEKLGVEIYSDALNVPV